MAETYNHKVVEGKWQKVWDDNKAFAATDDYSKPKYYALVEFPYPSGQGLHVGHPRPYTALDIVARKRRMQGYNVLYPMGWDAFGLPTENYAIKNKIHPKEVTKTNVARFKKQLHSLGYSFDWDREINTTDPEYYKWTQWIFLKLFKAGLAYKKEMPINWCTSCKVGLANEEVVNGVCERCGSEVVRKVKSEWMPFLSSTILLISTFSMSSLMMVTLSYSARVSSRIGRRFLSISTATTCPALSARYWVMVPIPGPISRTQSSFVMSAALIILFMTCASMRKF